MALPEDAAQGVKRSMLLQRLCLVSILRVGWVISQRLF
jgi:hypothetical protein